MADGTVGPSLGSDSIEAGLRTSALAVAFVVLVMVGYYRFSCVLAVGALGLYLLYSVGAVEIDENPGRADVDRAATRVLREAAFTPGRIEGIRVPVWIRIPVTFRPDR